MQTAANSHTSTPPHTSTFTHTTYVHTHTCVHTPTLAYIHTQTHNHSHIHAHTNTHNLTITSIHTHTHAHLYMHTFTHTHTPQGQVLKGAQQQRASPPGLNNCIRSLPPSLVWAPLPNFRDSNTQPAFQGSLSSPQPDLFTDTFCFSPAQTGLSGQASLLSHQTPGGHPCDCAGPTVSHPTMT